MDTLACCLFVFAVYCAFCVAARSKSAPVETAPEVKEETKPEEKPAPVVIVEPRPVAAFVAPAPVKTTPKTDALDLSTLSIRQLKALAKERTGTPNAIKKYSTLNKKELIAALS